MENCLYGLELYVKGDKKSLKEALYKLAEADDDFNGTNGPEYLTDEVVSTNELDAENKEEDEDDFANELRYESNADFYIEKALKAGGSEEKIIKTFLKSWADTCLGYYKLITKSKGGVTAIFVEIPY